MATPSPERQPTPPFPALVLAAGILWIIFGAIVIAGLLLIVLSFVPNLSDIEWNAATITSLALGGAVPALFAAFFVTEGVSMIRGTVPDTIPNAIGSILFAGIEIALGIDAAGKGQALQSVVSFLVATGFLSAAALAIFGRAEYEVWHKAARRTPSARGATTPDTTTGRGNA
ncbi:MAG: hypothetical protein U0793_21005 [Gemmataceae bacterium]